MNKTQFYTLSGALLASTALSSAANAGTIGRYNSSSFTSSALTIDSTVFSTTASTANAVVIGGVGATDRDIGMAYNNNFSGTTHWTTEFTIAGARFITGTLTTANVQILVASQGNAASVASSISGTVVCASVTSLVDLLVVNDCTLSNGGTGVATGVAHGIALTGITFNNASGLATAGASVSLTGRVYNPSNTTQIFEASATGNILTSRLPLDIRVTAGTSGTVSVTIILAAFTALSAPAAGLSLLLASVNISATGALGNTLAAASASSVTLAGTTSITVTSSILSSGAVRTVSLNAGAASANLSYLTAANFSSGTVTFSLTNTSWTAGGSSVAVTVVFQGTTAIPSAVAGAVSGSIVYNGYEQAATLSGTTAAMSQGGFRAEVNTFNASTNGPFGSYLRIHNNGQVAGVVTITVTNDDHTSGAALGSSFTTASILPGSTMQLSAAEIEGTTTSTKLPAGGANIPTASRVGSYTLNVTGPIVGYVQHILFDGNSVADLSGYRNSGNTSNQP